MLIQIHMIQNHSPANLNRDDLGAPKTCYFGGVLRSRISSQCLKRSIRLSRQFEGMCGGVRTRQLARLIAEGLDGKARAKAEEVMKAAGFLPKREKKQDEDEETGAAGERSKALVYTTHAAVEKMHKLFTEGASKKPQELAAEFAQIIAEEVAVPDMALSGRMLEPDKSAKEIWKGLGTQVEAALQVAHAISTHEARPEVDYYVAADDIPGEDAGAGFIDEAMFASACFYKYFSIDVAQLVANLGGPPAKGGETAKRTVAAFINAAALTTPAGKQNSFAAHNPPDGVLVEVRQTPISYANAFAQPVDTSHRDITAQSVAQLASYARDLDVGFGSPKRRLWFSPNLRCQLTVRENDKEVQLTELNYGALDVMVAEVLQAMGEELPKLAVGSPAGGA
jgi:CRISPR system Cascade subunit CasC